MVTYEPPHARGEASIYTSVLKRHRTHFPNDSRDGRGYYIRVAPVCVGGRRETENECNIIIVKL